MTQQEFFNRTGVEVSNDEFWAINEMYNYSEVDKDEFCKLWCKMNPVRVKNAKIERKNKNRDEKCKDTLEKWYHKWIVKTSEHYTLVAYTEISSNVVESLSYAGIRMGNAEVVSDLIYKVGKYLGYHN